MTEVEFDSERELCRDGNCLGVVVGGRCNLCGLAADGSCLPAPDRAVSDDASARLDDDGDPLHPATGDAAFDDAERLLCPDGACTGLVGSDGKCKVCGRSPAS